MELVMFVEGLVLSVVEEGVKRIGDEGVELNVVMVGNELGLDLKKDVEPVVAMEETKLVVIVNEVELVVVEEVELVVVEEVKLVVVDEMELVFVEEVELIVVEQVELAVVDEIEDNQLVNFDIKNISRGCVVRR